MSANYETLAKEAELLVAYDLDTHKAAYDLHAAAFQSAPADKTEYHLRQMDKHSHAIAELTPADSDSY